KGSSMNRFVVLLTLLAALAVPSAASALSYTAPAPLPKSPPDAGTKSLAGPEPSLAFDLNDGKHVYVAAPGSPEDDANGGINFWASADGGETWPIAKNIGSLAGGGDAEVETLIDHTVLTADLEVVSSAICHSKDYGKT